MAVVEVAGVGQEQGSEDPVLLLREQGGGRRYLAIWIGAPEATALAAAEVAATLPRPLTHRLLLDAVEAFGAQLVGVRLTALVDGQFHAELDLTTSDGGSRSVSARASDAVTLAVHQGCTIEVSEDVLSEAALPSNAVATVGGPEDEPDETEAGTTATSADVEDEVEALRRALSEATPDDFRLDEE
ncbi:bifunctional nuclease family protein [Actinomycetospora straminea]|uniref:Bifunctional nuclease family protein n=1 Tax=Actinomycetospora straminea TaxID=663607 RepID=A0ABP9E216_9PSEU|nr:bifunctional nuclease family protein [Actinomycetospora straminea]MDD7931001.1 bifunctional nuclease family protein [Actinomycetospora straminea]